MSTTVHSFPANADCRPVVAQCVCERRSRRAAVGVTIGTGLLFMIGAGTAVSHHSPGTVYRIEQITELQGTVTEYRYNNPHVRIHIDVVNDNGEIENWIAEGGTPNILRRNGWSSETFRPGDPIHIVGNPPRDAGSLFIHMLDVTLPDGSTLYAEDVQLGIAADRRRSRNR